MSKPQQILTLEPSNELVFKGPFTEYVNTSLTLTNPTQRDIYFKVKTTAPKYYCVRPNSGMIKATDKTQINVMLQPIESPESLESERNRHKFMIQSAIAPEEEQPPVDQFWKTADPTQIMDSKLRVVFQPPYGIGVDDDLTKENYNASGIRSSETRGLNTAFVNSQKDLATGAGLSTSAINSQINDPHSTLQKEIELRKMYQDEKANLERENTVLLEKLEKLTRPGSVGVLSMSTQDNIPLLYVILTAIFALISGLIMGKLMF